MVVDDIGSLAIFRNNMYAAMVKAIGRLKNFIISFILFMS